MALGVGGGPAAVTSRAHLLLMYLPFDADLPELAALRADLLRAGQHEQALRWLRHATTCMGWPRAAQYGSWHRDVARALDALGRGEEAARHNARFVTAWDKADPELQPHVAAARRRLTELVGEWR